VDTRSWYQKPRYQIGGGVVGVVLIGVAVYALQNMYGNPFSREEVVFDQSTTTGRR
jgi:hypothetical protein